MMKPKKMRGDEGLLQKEMERREKAVMTKHKWEEEFPDREILKNKT